MLLADLGKLEKIPDLSLTGSDESYIVRGTVKYERYMSVYE